MVKINILKCCHYTQHQWLKLLLSQKTNAFRFVLPKTREPLGNKNMLLRYYIAACLAQQLDSIADAFFYNIPAPRQSHHFHFIVISKRINELAHALFTISSGFNKHGRPLNTFIGHVLTFHAFMKLAVASGHQQYACKELVKICEQLAPADI